MDEPPPNQSPLKSKEELQKIDESLESINNLYSSIKGWNLSALTDHHIPKNLSLGKKKYIKIKFPVLVIIVISSTKVRIYNSACVCIFVLNVCHFNYRYFRMGQGKY